MNRFSILTVLAMAAALQGCGRDEQANAPQAAAPTTAGEPMAGMPGMTGTAPAADETATHNTTGEVTAVSGNAVTIHHQPVEGLGWPAMSMTFMAPDAGMLSGIQPGARVAFTFRKQGNDYMLTEIRPQ